MTPTSRYLTFSALGLVAVLGVAYWSVASFGSGMCANQQIAASDSPDHRSQVVVFERDCGATTDFSTQVIILPAGEELAGHSGNVFVVDSDHGRAAPGPGGGPWVEAQWLSPDSILIRFDAEARIFQQSIVVGRVNVRYVGIRRAAA